MIFHFSDFTRLKKLPSHQQFKRWQWMRYFFIFIILLLCIAPPLFFYWDSHKSQQKIQFAYVAKHNLSPPLSLKKSDFELQKFPEYLLPLNTFSFWAPLHNKTLTSTMIPGEILLPHHFQLNLNPDSVSAQFLDDFAFAMDESWFASSFPNIKPDDLVDIMTINPKDEEISSLILAQKIKVIDMTLHKKSSKKILTLNLSQADSEALLWARSLRLPLQILVHSALNEPEIIPQINLEILDLPDKKPIPINACPLLKAIPIKLNTSDEKVPSTTKNKKSHYKIYPNRNYPHS